RRVRTRLGQRIEDRERLVRSLHLLERAQHRLERDEVARIVRERRLPRLDRLAAAALGRVQPREAALVGAAGGGRGQRGEAQPDRDQLLGVTGLLEQVGEGREGLGCVRRERCPAARRRQQRLAVRGRREPVHEVRNQLGEALHRGGRGLADGRL